MLIFWAFTPTCYCRIYSELFLSSLIYGVCRGQLTVILFWVLLAVSATGHFVSLLLFEYLLKMQAHPPSAHLYHHKQYLVLVLKHYRGQNKNICSGNFRAGRHMWYIVSRRHKKAHPPLFCVALCHVSIKILLFREFLVKTTISGFI